MATVNFHDKLIQDASRLLYRARLLLEGETRTQYAPEFPAHKALETEAASTALLRAVAVLAAGAVNILADELDFREPVTWTEEELAEMERDAEAARNEQNAETTEASSATNDQASVEARQASEAPPSPDRGADGQHSGQKEQEPPTTGVAHPIHETREKKAGK